ncbi:hypothetical protein OHA72_27165 [Dactylosporangium sp. NBC_01737]|uniref:hypothetical protein n=1 Tax=Dactylosporangium sp. NBC_01737 TaxID=2975959 RepID=UPI002E11A05C|nr:hypothetical protein OHA72_27165 [Dactylosporangium sp. NBC_01737]
MLVGVTRIGAPRQHVAKGFVVVDGHLPATGRRGTAFSLGGGERAAGKPALWYAERAPQWLGSPAARAEWAGAVATDLAEAATRVPLLPASVAAEVDGRLVVGPPGDDRHVVEVASAVEQEVLCNLLREHVPLLIALTGRADPEGTGVGGSHRLGTSRQHVATRYLASTSPTHLARVEAELRRTDGVAQLERMDVHPATLPDGTPAVVLRCVDAAASVSTTAAWALLVAAFGLRARRLVRDGRRLRNMPQQILEENRARAVARGLRARLTVEEPAGRGEQPRLVERSARDLLRALIVDTLSVELDNLGATPQELFPIAAALDLPQLGLSGCASDDTLLRGWARQHRSGFAGIAGNVLRDAAPGGPCLASAKQIAPGRTHLVLGEWAAIVAARKGADIPRTQLSGRSPGQQQPGRDRPPRQRSEHRGRGGPRGGGQHQGSRKGDQA